MTKFRVTATSISGAFFLDREPVADHRGAFMRLFGYSELPQWGRRPIKQINKTITSRRGSLRGLHFQISPNEEAKLVTCLKGSVFDVILDCRRASSTYGRVFEVELNSMSNSSVIIPEGCAHGLQTLQDDTEMLYLHSEIYARESERTLSPLDPDLSINWPEEVTDISDKDKTGIQFSEL